MQDLYVMTRRGEAYEKRVMKGFKFVPLIGKKGWNGQ
jgi:hypothetical protein